MLQRFRQWFTGPHLERANWIAGILGTLVGIAGLIVALYFGLRSADTAAPATPADVEGDSNLEREISTLKDDLQAEQETSTDLREQRDEARQQVQELSAEVDRLQLLVPSAGPSSAQSEALLRNSGRVTLAVNGDGLNLNSNEPNFGVSPDVGGDGAVFFQGPTYRSGDPPEIYIIGADITEIDRPASLKTCSAATTYAELSESPTADFFETDRLCLRLSESDRFAAVQVVTFDDDRATVSIRVWDAE